jgi:hypothetical protein
MQSLAHQMILGHDFLKASGAIINCAQRCITLFDGLVTAALTNRRDRESVLRLTQSVVIPPQTEVIVHLAVPRRFVNVNSILETYEPFC